jgi:hypothetical protein
MDIKSWSDDIANLAVDALVDGGLISQDDFERAVSIVSEEIHVRLILGDYPPPATKNDESPKPGYR